MLCRCPVNARVLAPAPGRAPVSCASPSPRRLDSRAPARVGKLPRSGKRRTACINGSGADRGVTLYVVADRPAEGEGSTRMMLLLQIVAHSARVQGGEHGFSTTSGGSSAPPLQSAVRPLGRFQQMSRPWTKCGPKGRTRSHAIRERRIREALLRVWVRCRPAWASSPRLPTRESGHCRHRLPRSRPQATTSQRRLRALCWTQPQAHARGVRPICTASPPAMATACQDPERDHGA
jgi:hypothetical protein